MDEDVHGAIITGLHRREPSLDMVRVQDVGLRSAVDSEILIWAAREERVVVSLDKKTLASQAWNRVARGLPMSGVAIIRKGVTIGKAIDELQVLAVVANPDELRDLVVFLP
jgi:hypothetical protein